MYTIKDNKEKTIIINKSKFISHSYFVNSVNDAQDIIDSIKNEYNDATHICYAYIIDNNIKYSDDKEPNNTAGLPIYNVIDKNILNHVLVIVIRYFGGIKLGAGGLTRAYSNSAIEVINDNITELILGYIVEIKLDYDSIKNVEYILKEEKIISKQFSEDITIILEISENNIEVLKEKLSKYTKKISLLDKKYIRKLS